MAQPPRVRRRLRLRGWRRDAAAIAFSLFPMLVMAGLFSPAAIDVEPEPEAERPIRPRVLAFASDQARRPLLIPRDFSAGFIPELVDLERLFQTGGASPEARMLARLITFPRHHGDSIVLGDHSSALPAFLFKDALGSAAKGPVPMVVPRPFDDPILGSHGPGYVPLLPGGRGRPPGTRPPPRPPLVPEPASALLVGLGLALLASGRRARLLATAREAGRRRGYFQPIGS
jgi:hypothetical protein